MSDTTSMGDMGGESGDKKILTDFDQTNGLVDGLGGDDDGTVDGRVADDQVLGDDGESGARGDATGDGIGLPLLDATRTLDGEGDGAASDDTDEAVTPYSEEGNR